MEYKPPKVGQMNGEKKGINDVVWQTQFIAADVFFICYYWDNSKSS